MGERTILITGATDGLGKGLAERLAPTGARLLLHGRNEAKGERLLEELGASATGELVWCPADFSSLDQVAVLADRVIEEERLDVLVNNAGIGTDGARRRGANGERGRLRAPARRQLPRPVPAHQEAAAAARALRPLADRQRRLRRAGSDSTSTT